MKVIKLATIAAAMVAATIVLPATAQADDDYQQFASPSGNIRCLLIGENNPAPIAMCQISDYTYVAPPGAIKARDGTPVSRDLPPALPAGRDGDREGRPLGVHGFALTSLAPH